MDSNEQTHIGCDVQAKKRKHEKENRLEYRHEMLIVRSQEIFPVCTPCLKCTDEIPVIVKEAAVKKYGMPKENRQRSNEHIWQTIFDPRFHQKTHSLGGIIYRMRYPTLHCSQCLYHFSHMYIGMWIPNYLSDLSIFLDEK